MTKIATRLRVERVMKGQTQDGVAKLARMCGCTSISQFRISQLERGLIPRPDEGKVLSEIFGVLQEELFGRV